MNYIKLLIIIASVLICSCSQNKKNKNGWNERKGEYIIPEIGLKYTLPFEIDRWSIADPENLPSKIKFLGIDNENEVIVFVVTPFETPYKIENLNSHDIEKILYDIIRPTSSSKLVNFFPVLKREEEKWSFNVEYCLIEKQDTLYLKNLGYFFNTQNFVTGIVITAQKNGKYEITDKSAYPYITALQMVTQK